MWQDDKVVIIREALPGLKADDVQISITGDMLTLRGEYRQKEERNDDRYQMRENLYGSFERSLLLPSPVVADRAKAEFEDGILTITLLFPSPKRQSRRPSLSSPNNRGKTHCKPGRLARTCQVFFSCHALCFRLYSPSARLNRIITSELLLFAQIARLNPTGRRVLSVVLVQRSAQQPVAAIPTDTYSSFVESQCQNTAFFW
jgi:hypothetical protein